MQMLNRAAQVRRIRGGVTTRDDEFGLEGKGDKRGRVVGLEGQNVIGDERWQQFLPMFKPPIIIH